jgi:hypothetical protein
MDYHQYLQSASWKSLAQAARYRAGNACEFCGGNPDHVHHVKYPANKNYALDCLENLIVCCASCHAKQHGIRGDKMNELSRIDFEGASLCCIYIDNKPWVRFNDIIRPLSLESRGWNARHEAELEYDEDWKRMESLETKKLEPYVSEQGVLILGMRMGAGAPAKRLRKQLAVLATKKGTVVDENVPELNNDIVWQNHLMLGNLYKQNALRAIEYKIINEEVSGINEEVAGLKQEKEVANIRMSGIERKTEETNTKIVELLDQSIKFMTSGNYIEVNGVQHGIKPYGIYPNQNITNTQVFGLLCSKIYKELNSGETLPPKVLDGGGMVRRWPLEILKTAFSIFVRDYPNQERNYSIF